MPPPLSTFPLDTSTAKPYNPLMNTTTITLLIETARPLNVVEADRIMDDIALLLNDCLKPANPDITGIVTLMELPAEV